MKMQFYIWCSIILACVSTMAQTYNLLDTNFRKCLQDRYPTTVNAKGELVMSEASKLTGSVLCNSSGILNPDGIQFFTNISRLELANNAITLLPELSALKKLSYIDVSSNQLIFLPYLSQLKNLKELYANRNSIKTLPDLSSNDSLEVLYVHSNLLDTLPDLSNLKRLRQLNIVNNNLKAIPNLGKLWALELLICWKNKIATLPELSNLKYLTKIDAANNLLKVAPQFPPGSKIKTLILDHNKIDSLYDFSVLDSLSTVTLYNNNLTFKQLTKLTSTKNYDTIFKLSPQNTFNIGSIKTFTESKQMLLKTGIDAGISGVSYDWYKNGVFFRSVDKDLLELSRTTLQDSGKYHCLIKHPAFKQLNLGTDSFHVGIRPCIDFKNMSTNITGINCKEQGIAIFSGINSSDSLTYYLKSTSTNQSINSLNGKFHGLSEPLYTLSVKTQTNCEKVYPQNILIPFEACEEVLLTPNNDGDKDTMFFSQKGHVVIFDQKGLIVKKMSIPAQWDGHDNNGRVPQGYYTADINNGEEIINITVMY